MAKTYDPIATVTISTTTSSYTFTSIPSTYTDLVIACQDLSTTSIQGITVRVGNGSIDTGSNYSRVAIDGYSSAMSNQTTNASSWDVGVISPNGSGTSLYHFMDYANTNKYKTVLTRSGNPEYFRFAVGTWRSNSAINQIQVYPASYSWTAGTTLSLYGIKGA
jgi:hypothetical protein